jgi:drug/metabolite transporter (DMT)-like permease
MTMERRATLWLLGMTVIWGASFFSMQLATQGVEAAFGPDNAHLATPAFLFLRFVLATALLAAFVPASVRTLSWGAVRGGLILAVPFVAGFILQVEGLRRTTPAVSAFLTSLTVIATPAIGALFFRERFRALTVAGAAIAFAGVWVLADPGGGGLGTGEILTILGSVAWAAVIQLINVVTRRHPPEPVTLVQFAATAAAFGAWAVAGGVPWGTLVTACGDTRVALWVPFTALFCSVVAILILNRWQREVTPTRAAVIYTMEPVFAALFSWLLIAEPMTGRKLIGGAIIVAGNLVCEVVGARTAANGKEPPAVLADKDGSGTDGNETARRP